MVWRRPSTQQLSVILCHKREIHVQHFHYGLVVSGDFKSTPTVLRFKPSTMEMSPPTSTTIKQKHLGLFRDHLCWVFWLLQTAPKIDRRPGLKARNETKKWVLNESAGGNWLLVKLNREVISSLGGPNNGSCSWLSKWAQVSVNKRDYLFLILWEFFYSFYAAVF